MKERRTVTGTMCSGAHNFDVYFCEEKPLKDSYWLGICLDCGLTVEVPIKDIEEVFNGL